MNDLTNIRFGKLVAIEPTEYRDGTRIVWRCQCDCGEEAYVSSSNLTTGNTKSCGCIRSEKVRGRGLASKLDLTGKVFGGLVVIKDSGKRSHGSVVWECKCCCGNICYATSPKLRNGLKKSCGCRKLERQIC